MKQILQTFKNGRVFLEDVPPPALHDEGILVQSVASVISAGTEKMLLELGQKSMLGKAQARPDLVKKIIYKTRKEGFLKTWENIASKLEKPVPLGYSASGIIVDIGKHVMGFAKGERVAIAGAGYANHAQWNYVPQNLAAKIPDAVSFESAAYTTICSIALQGIRLANPQLGEKTCVIGLGLIGLITVQLLKANGCCVIGFDPLEERRKLALKMGAEQVGNLESAEELMQYWSNGKGADQTFITASTPSQQPIELAGILTRKCGGVIVVGLVGMNIPRNDYYKKELSIKVSMSYGPGRYDPLYEESGVDYPYHYVRWTEQRNLEAVLGLMKSGLLDMQPLTSHHFSFDSALEAYQLLQSESSSLGIILEYPQKVCYQSKLEFSQPQKNQPLDTLHIGFIGAGNYASLHLLPHLKKHSDVSLIGIAGSGGASSKKQGRKFGFQYGTSDVQDLIQDSQIENIWIATRHRSHASLVSKVLQAGKHVFVEKPLCLTLEELKAVSEAYLEANLHKQTLLAVGHNRRFSKMLNQVKDFFPTAPKQIIYRVNGGALPSDSWIRLPEEGGGMLVGEMCHFFDSLLFLTQETPVSLAAQSLVSGHHIDDDNLSVSVCFHQGSLATLCYSTTGDASFSKERIEVFSAGKVAVLDDFRRLQLIENGKKTEFKNHHQDKGQAIQIDTLVSAFQGQIEIPVSFETLSLVMKLVFATQESLRTGAFVRIK